MGHAMKDYIAAVRNFLKIPRKAILVIDDSELDRTFADRVLSRRYHVLAADSGASGIAVARQARPDLILLDHETPNMKGQRSVVRSRAMSRRGVFRSSS